MPFNNPLHRFEHYGLADQIWYCKSIKIGVFYGMLECQHEPQKSVLRNR